MKNELNNLQMNGILHGKLRNLLMMMV